MGGSQSSPPLALDQTPSPPSISSLHRTKMGNNDEATISTGEDKVKTVKASDQSSKQRRADFIRQASQPLTEEEHQPDGIAEEEEEDDDQGPALHWRWVRTTESGKGWESFSVRDSRCLESAWKSWTQQQGGSLELPDLPENDGKVQAGEFPDSTQDWQAPDPDEDPSPSKVAVAQDRLYDADIADFSMSPVFLARVRALARLYNEGFSNRLSKQFFTAWSGEHSGGQLLIRGYQTLVQLNEAKRGGAITKKTVRRPKSQSNASEKRASVPRASGEGTQDLKRRLEEALNDEHSDGRRCRRCSDDGYGPFRTQLGQAGLARAGASFPANKRFTGVVERGQDAH
ncbi:hypothetical protein L1887_55218 [Cichorium endivia]|nr:hypothetical protein L1887_55218 [Cichorium endivia]